MPYVTVRCPDRWHGRALKTPREVRNAIAYVLTNFRKHARSMIRAEQLPMTGIDPFSSGASFDGWATWRPNSGAPPPFALQPRSREPGSDEATEPPFGAARTWLASRGWRRHGLIKLDESPAL